MSWLAKLLGFSSLSDPRGVRADFCDYCLTISPHWVYDRAAALLQQTGTDPLRGPSESFQLCQICCSKSPLPPGSILMPQRTAAATEIDELIDQTNPTLYEEQETERISQQLSVMQSPAERKQLALQAFARSQEDLATDTFRLADIRIWAGAGLALYFGLKTLRRLPRLAVTFFALLVPGLVLYRFYFVPRLVRVNQRPAWIRLLTGTAISFGELEEFLSSHRQKFPRTARLLRSREYRTLGDDGLLHRDPLALKPGRDFLPTSGALLR